MKESKIGAALARSVGQPQEGGAVEQLDEVTQQSSQLFFSGCFFSFF